MRRPFIECHKYELDLAFKVTRIIENFDIWNYMYWRWHKLSSFNLKIFLMCVATSFEDLPKIHQPDQFDLCQGHSSKRHFQWKSMSCHLNRHIVLRPLDLWVPYQTCEHLGWMLQGIRRIRSLHHHFWIYGSVIDIYKGNWIGIFFRPLGSHIGPVDTPQVNTTRHTQNNVTGLHFWILWVKVHLFHYKQWDRRMFMNQ